MIVKRGDIFYADLSPVIGSEQGGLRPVLIVQNDVGNRYSPTVIAAAITSKTGKAKLPTHIDVSGDPRETPGLARDSVILLEQVRTIDKRRLRERIGHLDLYTMQKVNFAISVSFGLSEEPSHAAVASTVSDVFVSSVRSDPSGSEIHAHIEEREIVTSAPAFSARVTEATGSAQPFSSRLNDNNTSARTPFDELNENTSSADTLYTDVNKNPDPTPAFSEGHSMSAVKKINASANADKNVSATQRADMISATNDKKTSFGSAIG